LDRPHTLVKEKGLTYGCPSSNQEYRCAASTEAEGSHMRTVFSDPRFFARSGFAAHEHQLHIDRRFSRVHSTNYGPALPPNWGYSVGVKSTGAGIGSQAPSFIVGGVANDVISITMAPGATSFITLQTRCDAKAGFEVPKN
jgi:hypothetical protein